MGLYINVKLTSRKSKVQLKKVWVNILLSLIYLRNKLGSLRGIYTKPKIDFG